MRIRGTDVLLLLGDPQTLQGRIREDDSMTQCQSSTRNQQHRFYTVLKNASFMHFFFCQRSEIARLIYTAFYVQNGESVVATEMRSVFRLCLMRVECSC